jgi:mRNA interferase MazF
MIRDGMIVLVPFPHAETVSVGKVRPAVVIRRLPGGYDDWLICMLSSRISQTLDGFDELITEGDDDFAGSGLKISSVVRVSRLAVCHDSLVLGALGRIADARLLRIRQRLAEWLLATPS